MGIKNKFIFDLLLWVIINFPFPPLYLHPPHPLSGIACCYGKKDTMRRERHLYSSAKKKKVLSSLLSRESLGNWKCSHLKVWLTKVHTYYRYRFYYICWVLTRPAKRLYVIAIPFSAVLKNGQNFEKKCSV